jgi:hypothetical protein
MRNDRRKLSAKRREGGKRSGDGVRNLYERHRGRGLEIGSRWKATYGAQFEWKRTLGAEDTDGGLKDFRANECGLHEWKEYGDMS